MSLPILRRGSRGQTVKRWQNFLIGLGLLPAVANGKFGPLTEKATKAFQRSEGLSSDGIVGPATYGAALLLGFDIGFTDAVAPHDDPILVGTSPIEPATNASRKKMFGEFDFEPAPTANNAEAIKVLGNWKKKNIKTFFIPQLKGIPVFGTPSSGKMSFHVKAGDQLRAMWQAWAEADLIDRVLTYEGSYNARFVRGSRKTLSNHAYGSAFDINMRWNRLGQVPALEGDEGSVRELVAIANEHGFFWGGHFRKRPDGMHFEVAKLL